MSEDGEDSKESPPNPPQSIPQYIADAIQRQDEQSLRKVVAYAQQLTDRTPRHPTMTRDFSPSDIAVGDIIKHSSSKSTVKANKGQVVRVLDEEAVEIWDSDGKIRTVDMEDVTAVSEDGVASGLRETFDTGEETDEEVQDP